jgi:glycosyltransferase involved in cell wall biosynthesis
LHLLTWLNRGGAEMWLMHMLRAVPREVWAMDVCCKGDHCGVMAADAQLLGADVLHCPLPFYIGGFIKRLTGVLREGKYDLLHTHLGVHSALAVKAARRARVPVVSTFHNTAYPPQTALTMLPVARQVRSFYGERSIRYTLAHSNLVTAVSHGVAESIARQSTASSERPRVSYLGVPKSRQLNAQEESILKGSLQIGPEDQVILHVGRFLAAKNHRGVVEVFRAVQRHVSNAVLLQAGDGPLRLEIEKTVQAAGISGAVRFLGVRDDVSALMQISDVLLMPSHHEGLPLVVMEAGAAGLPIVASNIPGIAEGVAAGESALLHDVTDLDGMAKSVVLLLESRDRRRALASAGRDHYERQFSVEAASRRLAQLYEEVTR